MALTQKKLEDHIKQLHGLYEVSKSITSTLKLPTLLHLIVEKAAQIMGAKVCILRLLSPSGKRLVLKTSYGLNKHSPLLKENLMTKDKSVAQILRTKRPRVFRDLRREKVSGYLKFALRGGLFSAMMAPLIEKDKLLGLISIFSHLPCIYDKEDVEVLSMFASYAVIAIENARLFEETHLSYLNTVKALTNIIDAKDSYTYGHSERVMHHALNIAEEMGLSEQEKEVLKYASLLHDIGKIGVDINILRKQARLSREEWREVSSHPKLGARMVRDITFLQSLAPIILHHHERYKGGGYPDSRLSKNKIPLGARILAVADAYEAMVSDRPYRKALSKTRAIKELVKGSGSQFDPKVVRVFLRVLRRNRLKSPHYHERRRSGKIS